MPLAESVIFPLVEPGIQAGAFANATIHDRMQIEQGVLPQKSDRGNPTIQESGKRNNRGDRAVTNSASGRTFAQPDPAGRADMS